MWRRINGNFASIADANPPIESPLTMWRRINGNYALRVEDIKGHQTGLH